MFRVKKRAKQKESQIIREGKNKMVWYKNRAHWFFL